MVYISRGKQGQFSFFCLRKVFSFGLSFLKLHILNNTLLLSTIGERFAKVQETLTRVFCHSHVSAIIEEISLSLIMSRKYFQEGWLFWISLPDKARSMLTKHGARCLSGYLLGGHLSIRNRPYFCTLRGGQRNGNLTSPLSLWRGERCMLLKGGKQISLHKR